MGIGPSSKETTLHHFNDPLIEAVVADKDLDLAGIIIVGTPEVYDNKMFTSERASFIAECMRVDGAIISIDSWGNSHVDFTNTIEQVASKNIPTVGMSFVGMQARFVVTNPYMDTIVDINKTEAGIENCIVGDNNLTEYDAMKALALLKNKIRKAEQPTLTATPETEIKLRKLVRKTFHIDEVIFGEKTFVDKKVLSIRKEIEKSIIDSEPLIKDITVKILQPDNHGVFVNSNLDYSPIAAKAFGNKLGEGITHVLSGVTVMTTAVEEISGFQPANIGSSEGILKEQVHLDRRGTPKEDDIIIHVDVLLNEGEARTREGIAAGHRATDRIVEEIRSKIRVLETMPYTKQEFYDVSKPGKKKIVIIKLVSGLGCMYETSLFPNEPAGFVGAKSIMAFENVPIVVTPNQYRDGVVHAMC